MRVLPSGCHEWTGRRDENGYGQFRAGKADGFRNVVATRWLWERRRGPIPAGLVLDHFRCDWPPCVNLEHVRPVTQRENLLRGNGVSARSAAATRCPQGHPYDDANTWRDKNGDRVCRKCRAIRQRNGRAGRGYRILPSDVVDGVAV